MIIVVVVVEVEMIVDIINNSMTSKFNLFQFRSGLLQ